MDWTALLFLCHMRKRERGQMDGGTRGNEFYLLMWLSLLPLCLSAAGSLDRWDERWTDGRRTTPRSIPLTAAAAAIFRRDDAVGNNGMILFAYPFRGFDMRRAVFVGELGIP